MKRGWHIGSRGRRSVGAVVSSAALVAGGLIWGAPSALAATSPCTDGSAPAQLSTVICAAAGNFTLAVPPGTTSVDLDVIGGGGGAGIFGVHAGGNAAEVTGTATLPSGTAYLYVIVGVGGVGGDGSVSGGGGGGSAVLAEDASHALLAKLVIAGGGGGSGDGGAGGDAGSAGAVIGGGGPASPGSAGVGATGGAGGAANSVPGLAGGNDDPSALTVAVGGAGGAAAGKGSGGHGGGGYGGGGGGGLGVVETNIFYLAGGGGGSSLASSYLASASVGIAAGTGGSEIAVIPSGAPGATGVVTLTFHGVVVPDAPTAVTAVPGEGQASVSFTAPASDGGSAITGYEYSTDDGFTWQPLTATGSAPIMGTITDLINGTTYQVQVRAINSVGPGPASEPVAVTPAATATATVLTAVPASVTSGEQVTLTAIVTAAPPGTGIPTGTVTFAEGGTTLGTGAVNSSGVATLSIGELAVGAHSIIASYAGDGSFAGSASTPVPVMVTVNAVVNDSVVTPPADIAAPDVNVAANGTPPLAATGADVGWFAQLASILLLVGLALLGVGQVRRRGVEL